MGGLLPGWLALISLSLATLVTIWVNKYMTEPYMVRMGCSECGKPEQRGGGGGQAGSGASFLGQLPACLYILCQVFMCQLCLNAWKTLCSIQPRICLSAS